MKRTIITAAIVIVIYFFLSAFQTDHLPLKQDEDGISQKVDSLLSIMTLEEKIGQIPIHYDMRNTGRPFNADNKYTSKYLDVPNEPLYVFGHGLSYTTFDYSLISLSSKTMTTSDS